MSRCSRASDTTSPFALDTFDADDADDILGQRLYGRFYA